MALLSCAWTLAACSGAEGGAPTAGSAGQGLSTVDPPPDAGADGSSFACTGPVPFETMAAAALSHCGGELCHMRAPFGGQLDLTPPSAYASLVGVPSHVAPSFLLVKPGDPDASYLWRALINDLPSNTGKAMPQALMGWRELSVDALRDVRCWILQGAPRPTPPAPAESIGRTEP